MKSGNTRVTVCCHQSGIFTMAVVDVATSGMVKAGNTRVTVCGHQSGIVTMAVVDVATSGM